jgi:hypothetical protein
VVVVAKLSSKRSTATAAAQSCSHHCPAARKHHLVDSHAHGQSCVGISKSRTTATKTMKPARNVLSSWRSDVCVANTLSKPSLAGCKTRDAVRSAARSFDVASITVVSPVIAAVNAKMRMARLAHSHVVSPRNFADTQTRIFAIHRSAAKRISHVRARSSSPVVVRLRSRR